MDMGKESYGLNLKDYDIQEFVPQTDEIQRVIDEADQKKLPVIIPAGCWVSGTLNLRSASLYLQKGAVLKASEDIRDYPVLDYTHNEMIQVTSFLYSMNAEGLRIGGEGTIDLSGDAFYDMDAPNIPECGIPLLPEQRAECPRLIGKRLTQPIFFSNCMDVIILDIHIRNASCWTMSFNGCEDILVLDVTIRNNPVLPNNDGMHFCGCRNVIIRGCNISAGDDCIALSGITDWNRPCENVTISDCILKSVSKAIVLGYMHSIVRNVTITNCVITDSQRGLCFMSSKGSGLVEHVVVSNLRIDTHIRAGNWWGNGEAIELMALEHHNSNYLNSDIVRDLPANIRDIQMMNICCTSENVIALVGDDNIEDIRIDGLSFEKKDSVNRYLKGDRTIDVSPSQRRVELPPDGEYWLYQTGCRNVQMDHLTIRDFHGEKLKAYIH